MSDYNLRALLIRSEKVEVELANLREIDAQLVKDQDKQSIVIARLRSDTDLLKSDMSEVFAFFILFLMLVFISRNASRIKSLVMMQ